MDRWEGEWIDGRENGSMRERMMDGWERDGMDGGEKNGSMGGRLDRLGETKGRRGERMD